MDRLLRRARKLPSPRFVSNRKDDEVDSTEHPRVLVEKTIQTISVRPNRIIAEKGNDVIVVRMSTL